MRKILPAAILLLGMSAGLVSAGGGPGANIYQATLMEANQETPEISTAEMQKALGDGNTMVFDTRSQGEYAIDHLPGAFNAVPEGTDSGRIFAAAADEIERRTRGDKTIPVVLYCNGPVCGKSRKVAALLVGKGYTDVRRYQLGIPIWRVLQVVTESSLEGVRHIVENDRTAVLIDARDAGEYQAGSIPGARNVPLSRVAVRGKKGEIGRAKKDGRLPVEDHNTRIIVFGRDGAQARALVDALARKASFHNVSYFGGGFEALRDGLR